MVGAAAVVTLIVIGVVLAFALSGGASSKANVPSRGSLTNALPEAADVQGLLKGIAQRGNVLGSPVAPVTMIEYIDLQCPFCAQFETQALPSLISRYVRTGKVKVEARPLAFIGPDSERGRAAAIAAGLQDKLFNFVQLLYLNQGPENGGWLNDNMVEAAAASIPSLDVPRLLAARSSSGVRDQEHTVDAQATAHKVQATPTILVGKSGTAPKEVTLASPTDVGSIAAAIAAVLR
ncbi:MAG: DsbA family protein [Actinomycetota bacterium]|nr:DsbA family protein [Actinomycetota bacterium]